MPKNRTIYQSEALFVGPSPATGGHWWSGTSGYTEYNLGEGTKVATDPGQGAGAAHANGFTGYNLIKPLVRVQNVTYRDAINRTDVNQWGELGRIDSVVLESPTVGMDFSYIVQSLYNERVMGFTVSSGTFSSALTNILNKTSDEKNYFIKTIAEGNDAVASSAVDGTVTSVGVGNGFLASYSVEGSVGNFPTASVTVEALNLKVDTSPASKLLPSVNPEDGSAWAGTDIWGNTFTYRLPGSTSHPSGLGLTISALRPGDIVVSLGTFGNNQYDLGPTVSDMKIQSFSIGVDMTRRPLQKLGSKFAFSREIEFPINVNCSITADVGDMHTGNLVDFINNDSNVYELGVKVYRPNTAAASRTDVNVATFYLMRGAKLDSIEVNGSIGPNKSATLNFSTQVFGATSPSGFFLSGIN